MKKINISMNERTNEREQRIEQMDGGCKEG